MGLPPSPNGGGPSPWYEQPWAIAASRALVGGAVIGGLSFFTALQAGSSLRVAEVATGVAFFGYLAARGVFEGWIDQRAQVTSQPPAQ